jgi:hypothetical protein
MGPKESSDTSEPIRMKRIAWSLDSNSCWSKYYAQQVIKRFKELASGVDHYDL